MSLNKDLQGFDYLCSEYLSQARGPLECCNVHSHIGSLNEAMSSR